MFISSFMQIGGSTRADTEDVVTCYQQYYPLTHAAVCLMPLTFTLLWVCLQIQALKYLEKKVRCDSTYTELWFRLSLGD